MSDGSGVQDAPALSPSRPEHAFNRRQALDADIRLGWMEIWVGVGRNQAWPWLDLAIRIGKGWGTLVDHWGGMVKRPDFIAFLPQLRAFVAGQVDLAEMESPRGSLRLRLLRDAAGWLRGEATFRHGPNEQTVRFAIWDESLRAAVPAFEAAVARIEGAWLERWRPRFGKHDRMPRAALLEPQAPPSEFPAWDSGLGDGGDISIACEVDGYGWYHGEIRIGGASGDFGGGWLSDGKGDLVRAGLMLLTGQTRAEVLCETEPGQTRIEFETVTLRMEQGPEPGVPGRVQRGCWVRIRDLDEPPGEDLVFEQLARSPRAVAEAIYAMGVTLFEQGAGPWSDAMAALEGALASVPAD